MTNIRRGNRAKSSFRGLSANIFDPQKKSQMPPSLREDLNVIQQEKVADPANGPAKDEKFFPAGAIVFFVCLVLLSLIFWYGIYFLMIERS